MVENLSYYISTVEYLHTAQSGTKPAAGAETKNQVAARVIADAFQHYPLMVYAFEGLSETQRVAMLRKLYDKCVSATDLYGGIVTRQDMLGAAIWLPGENFRLSMLQEIRSGMLLLPFALGVKATLRLMSHENETEGWVRKNAGPQMGYIWNVGVSAHARGRGYSRLLINQCIDQMRMRDITECWLKTDDAKNVPIYEKQGFTVMNHMVAKSSGIGSWAMRRMIA